MLREPLVFPVAALALGIALAHQYPVPAPTLLAAAAALAALTALALFRNFRPTAIAACLAGLVLSGAFLEIVHSPAQPPRLDVPDLSVTILSGCVVQTPALTGDRELFILELGNGGIGRHARARVSMFAHPGEELPHLQYGQRVDVEGVLRLPHNFGNPDAFDYRRFLARQDVFWTLSSQQITPQPGACGNPFDRAISTLRAGALDRIASLYRGSSPETAKYNQAMLDAVLIGENSGLDRIWTDDYRSTGTYHAIIISGFHVGILAGFFLFLLRICFIPRVPATLLTVAAIWLYALVTGLQTPAVRSAAGMTLFAIGGVFFRDRRLLNILAAVALFFLLFDPDQLFDAGFQLSFLAVAFVAIFAVPLIEATSEPLALAVKELDDAGRDVHLPVPVASKRVELRLYAETLSAVFRLPKAVSQFAAVVAARIGVFVYDTLVISAVIQVGLALPMAVYFHRVSFTGLSANVLVVPLLGLLVPIGFVAVFTGWHWVGSIAALLLDLSRRVVGWHAQYEPNWRIPSPPFLLSLAICVALALAAVRYKTKPIRWAAFASVAILLGLLVWFPFAPRIQPGLLEMSAVDVGQGDCIFLAYPDGRTMLVDTGGIATFAHADKTNPNPIRMDIGEDVVAPYLWTRALKQIDVIAISHLHDDHVGGLPAILNDFKVKELWVGATPPCEIWTKIQNEAKAHGTVIRHLFRGQELSLGGARIQVLEPSPDYTPGAKPGNNDSLVMRISYGQRSFLLTGDMEKQIEADFAQTQPWPHADVLKVGHHGSKTSSMPDFLDQVHPALAVISDGRGNMYGHPHPITLESLNERHILTYRTDLEGLVSVFTDGRRLWRE